TRSKAKTVFVLGGGGNLGAIQVGMLRAALERGIRPDVVVGCSVGAINAAALAADPTPEGARQLQEAWLGVHNDMLCPSSRLSSVRLLTRKARSLTANDGLRNLLRQWLPYHLLEEAAIPVEVVATDLRTGKEHWFATGSVDEAVLASAALPAVFPPVVIDGTPYIDGGVVNNVPISRAVELGATRVVVMHVGNFERPRPEPRRPIDVLLQSFSIARNHRFLAEVGSTPEGVEMIVLPGIDPGRLRYNDFSRSRMLMERAYATSSAFLDASHLVVAGA
ncbi:MAG TPA: patatin-like phospholipase family protein, partial [Acidimicrobiales bacterium]